MIQEKRNAARLISPENLSEKELGSYMEYLLVRFILTGFVKESEFIFFEEVNQMSFKAVASKIARKEGISKKRASAILAASTRRASAHARKVNPRLNRVHG